MPACRLVIVCCLLGSGLFLPNSGSAGERHAARTYVVTGNPYYVSSTPQTVSGTPYYVSSSPYVVGTPLYAPIQTRVVTLDAGAQTADAETQDLGGLLGGVLADLLRRLIERELPLPPQPPPAADCTSKRLKAIEDHLTNPAGGAYQPPDCRTGAAEVDGLPPDQAPLTATATAAANGDTALTQEIDGLSRDIQDLTKAINGLRDELAKKPTGQPAPAPAPAGRAR